MSDAGMAVEMDNVQPAEEAPTMEGEEAPNMEGAIEEALPEDGMQLAAIPGKRKRKNADGVEKEPVRKPRWGDKSFEEITIADIETIVRRCNSLEQQVEANAEAAQELKEAKKRERELERQVEGVGPKEVALAKQSIAKQFLSQMHYVYPWNSELKNGGREVMAFLPNVSPDLLLALGGDINASKGKQSKIWFEKVPSKTVTQPTPKEMKDSGEGKPGGPGLLLSPTITLKYIKTNKELQIKASYRFGEVEIKVRKAAAEGEEGAAKVKSRGRGRKKAAEGDAAEGNAEEEGGEDEEAFEDAPAEEDAVASAEGGA